MLCFKVNETWFFFENKPKSSINELSITRIKTSMIMTFMDINKMQKYDCFIVKPQRYLVDLYLDDKLFAKIENY